MTVPVSWEWFHCEKAQKCIHISGRCDMNPNPACIYKNDEGKMMAEDEENCLDDYVSKGLISNSATYQCQSKSNNEKSLPVMSTVWNLTIHDFMNQTVIAQGTIVNIRATRCDGIVECMGGSDEKDCGMQVDETILAGMILLTINNLKNAFRLASSICSAMSKLRQLSGSVFYY